MVKVPTKKGRAASVSPTTSDPAATSGTRVPKIYVAALTPPSRLLGNVHAFKPV
jgi:hypothetical protein